MSPWKPSTVESLGAYYHLLEFWNEKVNLTAFSLERRARRGHRSPPRSNRSSPRSISRGRTAMASQHGPQLASRPRMLDIGSGGGSPAIPMKIAHSVADFDDGRVEDAEVGIPARGHPPAEPGRYRPSKQPGRGPPDAARAARVPGSRDHSGREESSRSSSRTSRRSFGLAAAFCCSAASAGTDSAAARRPAAGVRGHLDAVESLRSRLSYSARCSRGGFVPRETFRQARTPCST